MQCRYIAVPICLFVVVFLFFVVFCCCFLFCLFVFFVLFLFCFLWGQRLVVCLFKRLSVHANDN